MESELLLNMGGNLVTLALALGVYVAYKRCVHSKCAVHSSWLECESSEIQELKFQKNKTMLKKALSEIRIETIRDKV
jgi:hypothetical protein